MPKSAKNKIEITNKVYEEKILQIYDNLKELTKQYKINKNKNIKNRLNLKYKILDEKKLLKDTRKKYRKFKNEQFKIEKNKQILANKKNNKAIISEKESMNALIKEQFKSKLEKNKKVKVKRNFKKWIREFPIRMFKELQRVSWGKNDKTIVTKFILVLFFIVSVALFIWGFEFGITAILKLCKIALI